MTISASISFNVEDSAVVSAELSVIVLPPVGYGTGGRGRLVHPDLGILDYANTPDETSNMDGEVIVRPEWLHGKGLTGGVNTVWDPSVKDTVVVERWMQEAAGAPINHLRALYEFFVNPPDPTAGQYIQWHPNYATSLSYQVALVDLRSGGESYKLGRRLASIGYAPSPVELYLQIVSQID